MRHQVNFLKLFQIAIFSTIGIGTPLNTALSEGVDWESSINVGSNFAANNNAQGNNLPGVNKIPSGNQNNRQTDCNDIVPGSSQIGGNQIASRQCGRKKKPLIVLRENQVGGLLFEFPR